ncbi:MAG: hypothetical protein AB2L10_05060 [Methanospirillum sp.]
MLQYYYDLSYRDEFSTLFGSTWIGAHPTPSHNQYIDRDAVRRYGNLHPGFNPP